MRNSKNLFSRLKPLDKIIGEYEIADYNNLQMGNLHFSGQNAEELWNFLSKNSIPYKWRKGQVGKKDVVTLFEKIR